MSQGVWNLIKSSKRFNVHIYRQLIRWLVFSLALNVMLCLLVSRIYFTRPDFNFYSTDGVTPPIELEALSAPNESATPLLLSTPSQVSVEKPLPE